MEYTVRLKEKYKAEIKGQLADKFGYKSVMSVPQLKKIVISQGIGEAVADKKIIDSAVADLSLIAGQKAMATFSKKDVSNFKVRKGFPVGCKVTLRKDYMYEFLERLCAVALPRTRDFRGLSFKSFDSMGNYSFGIKEQIVFAEIDYDKVDSLRGMDVIITTSASSDNECYELLRAMGLPIREKRVANNTEEENG